MIPRAPTTLLATEHERPAPPATVASRSISGPAAVADNSPRNGAANKTRTITYRVKRGDTLFTIARLFDTTVDKIKSLNRLRSNLIAPGARLKIVAE